MSFDAWGKRRETGWLPIGANGIVAFDTKTTTRGFTGHEMIDSVGLVHMNGRIYDPEIGRFLSADPHVQAPDNLQSWNRYSYVINNPLSLTDPSGFFFSGLFRAIGNFLSSVFRAIDNVVKVALSNPIVRALLQIVGCYFAGPACPLVTAAITLGAGGSIVDALKAGAFAFASMGIFDAVGFQLDGARAALGGAFGVVKAAVHGVIGGALSVAQGGSFLQGFASNAIGALTGSVADSVTTNPLGNTLIVAAGGCAAAIVTGGKCAQGAVTAAFANLYNKFRLGSRTYLNPWDVGNDAHRTLQRELGSTHGYQSERMFSDEGAFFAGRVDLLDPARPYSQIWEIKPDDNRSIANGFAQVTGYIFAGNLTGSGFYHGDAFGGATAKSLPGEYGWYHYRLAAPGVITYNFTPDRNVFAFNFATYWAIFYATLPSQLPGVRVAVPARGGYRR